MTRRILVIAAHADDEALGCGGTLARHAAEGDTVHALFLADGVTSRRGSASADAGRRMEAAERAHVYLGIAGATYLGLPDNRLDTVPLLDIVQMIEGACAEQMPDVVYTHHFGDLNIDHRVAHAAVMTACRPLPGSSVKEIYAFEVISSTEWQSPQVAPFVPSHYVDISHYVERKLEALQAYGDEMRAPPHSRNLEHVVHLARHRGHTVGLAAAEAFVAVRVLR